MTRAVASFVNFDVVVRMFRDRRVAIVGSAPSAALNAPGFVDSHDLVVRVNNYKLTGCTGARTDAHYSYYGNAIRKTPDELRRDGVRLCWCKCPDSKPIESEWHERRGKQIGIDFRWIYKTRRDWWFCDTYVPDDWQFMAKFQLLKRHIPTTGFACILDVLECYPASVYVTGFDFFESKLHNINEPWRAGDPNDPIGHDMQRERTMLRDRITDGVTPITVDNTLREILNV